MLGGRAGWVLGLGCWWVWDVAIRLRHPTSTSTTPSTPTLLQQPTNIAARNQRSLNKRAKHHRNSSLNLLGHIAVYQVLRHAQGAAHGCYQVYLPLCVVDTCHYLQCLWPQLCEILFDLDDSLKPPRNILLSALIDPVASNGLKLLGKTLLPPKISNQFRAVLLVQEHQLDFLLYYWLDHGVF